MSDGFRRKENNKKSFVERLDRTTRDINMFLLVLAIGLAMLDFTVFCAARVSATLPPSSSFVQQPAAAAAVPASAAYSRPGPASGGRAE